MTQEEFDNLTPGTAVWHKGEMYCVVQGVFAGNDPETHRALFRYWLAKANIFLDFRNFDEFTIEPRLRWTRQWVLGPVT